MIGEGLTPGEALAVAVCVGAIAGLVVYGARARYLPRCGAGGCGKRAGHRGPHQGGGEGSWG